VYSENEARRKKEREGEEEEDNDDEPSFVLSYNSFSFVGMFDIAKIRERERESRARDWTRDENMIERHASVCKSVTIRDELEHKNEREKERIIYERITSLW
jgi:hypothetical protein